MKIKKITKEREQDLTQFLQVCGSSLETFRYFSSRPISNIRKHVVSFLGYEENVPVAYGHLDPEEGVVWLGICVAEAEMGKGYGREMMKALIEESESQGICSISLSVDRSNNGAIRLYEKFGFQMDRVTEHTCFYIRKKT